MNKISACILTYNSAGKIERLLKSLDFADEIVIVDSGSTDNTLDIARKYTSRIFCKKLEGFGNQRNYCAEKASNDWVLALDSDEVISKELSQEIKSMLEKNDNDGYMIPRKTYFAGKPIMHSGWYPDSAIRLYNRKKMSFSNAEVHEKVVPQGKIGQLKNPIDHYSYESVKDYWGRYRKYSAMQVKNANVCKNHLNLILVLLKPIYRFLRMYFWNLGFLDGWRGLFLAVASSVYDFRVHYLAEKQILENRGTLYIIGGLTLILALSQGFLINKFGYLAIAIPLFLAILSLLLFNLKTSLFVLIFSILSGQVVRIYLSTGGGIVLSDLVVPTFVLAWLFYKAVKDPKLAKSPIDFSLGLFLIVLILTFLFNIGRFFSLISFSYLIKMIFYLALFWPLYDLLRDRARLEFSEKIISYLMYSLVGLGVLQLIYMPYLFFLMPLGWDPHLNRMVSTFLDPNFLAAFLCIGFALGLAKFYTSEKSFFQKIWPLGILGLAIIFTFSRSGYLMLAIILLVFTFFKDRKILIFGLIGLLIITFAVPKVKTRILGGFNIDASASLRFGSWQDGFKIIDSNFYSGVGYNNLEEAKLDNNIITVAETSSHSAAGIDSSLMVIWATTGIFGILIYLYWFSQNVYFGVRSYFKKKNPYTKNLGLAIVAIFLGLLVDSVFVNTLFYSSILILIAFVLAIFYNQYEQNS